MYTEYSQGRSAVNRSFAEGLARPGRERLTSFIDTPAETHRRDGHAREGRRHAARGRVERLGDDVDRTGEGGACDRLAVAGERDVHDRRRLEVLERLERTAAKRVAVHAAGALGEMDVAQPLAMCPSNWCRATASWCRTAGTMCQ